MPRAIATGDLNADGKVDLVVSTSGLSTLSVLWGLGDGTFMGGAPVNAGTDPWGIGIADFNRDGKADLVVSNYTGGNVTFMRGNGDGSFDPPVAHAAGEAPAHLAVGDVNFDSNLDVVVINVNGQVTALLGNGDGTFQPAKTSDAGTSPWNLALADFNDDHKMDILTGARWGNGITLELGKGDGAFTPKTFLIGAPYLCVAVANMDANPIEDVAVGIFDGLQPKVVVLSNLSGSGYTKQQVLTVTDIAMSVLVADFNRDGKIDIVTGSEHGGAILLGNGDGTFQPEIRYTPEVAATLAVSADFNGDGAPDLAVAGRDSSITLLINQAEAPIITSLTSSLATFARPANIKLTAGGVSRAARVEFYRDVNGDGAVGPGDILLGTDYTAADGWSITCNTAAFSLGTNKLLAVGYNAGGLAGNVVATAVSADNSIPGGVLAADPVPVTRGYPVKLYMNNYGDADGMVVKAEFFRDNNANGVLDDGDTLLGVDTDPSDGLSIMVGTDGFDLGPIAFLGHAMDNDSAWTSITGIQTSVFDPWDLDPASTFSVSPGEVIRPGTLTFQSMLPPPPGKLVTTVEIYTDADGNGVFAIGPDTLLGVATAAGNNWTLESSSGGMHAGQVYFFLRARDADGVWSKSLAAWTTILNLPPTITQLESVPNPATRAQQFVLTPQAQDDLAVTSVDFFADNGDGVLGGGDALIGRDTDGTDGWSHVLYGGNYRLGDYMFWAVAYDGEGGVSAPAAVTVSVVNAPPVVGSLSSDVTTITRGAPVTLVAHDVSDPDAALSEMANAGYVRVYFFRDANGNGAGDLDEIIGYDDTPGDGFTFTLSDTQNLPLGRNLFLARGVDNENTMGAAAVCGVHVVHPVGTWTSGNVVVTAYDLGGEVDIVASDIMVRFGRGDTITSILLRGRNNMSGLALSITGAASVGSIVDARLGTPADIAFISSSCGVRIVSIKTTVAGYNVGGLIMNGQTFPYDMDGDGMTSDRTALFFGGQVPAKLSVPATASVFIRGSLIGDVTVNSGLGTLRVLGWTMDSDISVGMANIRGDSAFLFDRMVNVSIASSGGIRLLSAVDWVDDGKPDTLQATYLGTLMTRGDIRRGLPGDMQADIIIGSPRGMGAMTVRGSLLSTVIVAGSISRVAVLGWATNSKIWAQNNILSVQFGACQHTDVLAGVGWDVGRHAKVNANFITTSKINSIRVIGWRGLVGPAVIDSNFSASQVGVAYFASAQLNNSRTQFGVWAKQSQLPRVPAVRSVTLVDGTKRIIWPSRLMPVFNQQDMVVQVL
jgi:hypothetical protein